MADTRLWLVRAGVLLIPLGLWLGVYEGTYARAQGAKGAPAARPQLSSPRPELSEEFRGFERSLQGERGAARYETPNFTVTARDFRLAQEFARAAERLRAAESREWLGYVLPERAERVPIGVEIDLENGSGGSTELAFAEGRLASAGIRLRGDAGVLLRESLGHEILHVLLADYFGAPLPPWADEGIALQAGRPEEAERRRRNALALWREGRLRSLAPFFEARAGTEDAAFGVQSQSLVSFLIERGGANGRRELLRFLDEGRGGAWEAAARARYGFATLPDLEAAWRDWLNPRTAAK